MLLLGKGYAKEFARKGLKIVLISRNLEKLTDVAKEIAREYCVEVKTVKADFSQADNVYNRISKVLTGLDIAVLVNNVGAVNEPAIFTKLDNM